MSEEKKGFFKRLKAGLTKTRASIAAGLNSIFSGFSSIDEDFYEELEETLILSDIGVQTTEKILENLREQVKEQKIKEPEECRQLLIDDIKAQMKTRENAYDYENQKCVILVIGVNGVGKTTSIGKISANLKSQGKRVVVAAADTFRAAAIEQLAVWCDRAGVELIKQSEGSDPAAVVYDAIAAAKKRDADVLIVDTAGRLHNKKNLMDELAKIGRVLDRELPGAARETLLVLDSTTGRNALVQAKEFKNATDITGLILTKLDGTAKGGAVFSIRQTVGLPVKYIGVGEQIDDMQPFVAEDFVKAILGEDGANND